MAACDTYLANNPDIGSRQVQRIFLTAFRQAHAVALIETEALKDLVAHCWAHSGDENCGWSRMRPEQRDLYQAVLAESNEEEKPPPEPAPEQASAIPQMMKLFERQSEEMIRLLGRVVDSLERSERLL